MSCPIAGRCRRCRAYEHIRDVEAEQTILINLGVREGPPALHEDGANRRTVASLDRDGDEMKTVAFRVQVPEARQPQLSTFPDQLVPVLESVAELRRGARKQ